MADKTFVVSHPQAREPLTIKGKTLEEALENEALNPDLWQEIEPLQPSELPEDG